MPNARPASRAHSGRPRNGDAVVAARIGSAIHAPTTGRIIRHSLRSKRFRGTSPALRPYRSRLHATIPRTVLQYMHTVSASTASGTSVNMIEPPLGAPSCQLVAAGESYHQWLI